MTKRSNIHIGKLFLFASLFTIVASCVHQPFPPSDTGGTGGGTGSTGGGGGAGGASDSCDPDTVYFVNDVLPLLSSSCAIPGCHDAATAKEGVVLDNYNNIVNTGKVKAGKPNKSKLYEVLIKNDPDEKMPPPGSGITLTNEQINMVYTWISQGAKNNSCDPTGGQCDTSNVSFSANIQPLINSYCKGCHSGSSPQGNVSLDNYNNIKTYADNGQLLGSVKWSPGYTPMPYNQPQLDTCYIKQIEIWIKNGAPNN